MLQQTSFKSFKRCPANVMLTCSKQTTATATKTTARIMKEYEESSTVKVVVRLRPMNEMEKKMGVTPAISASSEQKTVTAIKGHGMTKTMFAFNDVYTSFATQREVFEGSISTVIE